MQFVKGHYTISSFEGFFTLATIDQIFFDIIKLELSVNGIVKVLKIRHLLSIKEKRHLFIFVKMLEHFFN